MKKQQNKQKHTKQKSGNYHLVYTANNVLVITLAYSIIWRLKQLVV